MLAILPIVTDIAERARETMRDEFGHDLRIEEVIAPCRLCLRIPSEPEPMILLSYQPLADRNPYAEIGPIFIHAHACAPYRDRTAIPPDFLVRPLVVRAYDTQGCIADAVVAEPGRALDAAQTFLASAQIAEVHVRHVTYTCYDFKIVRGE